MVIPAARLKFRRQVSRLRTFASSQPKNPRRLVLAILYLWCEKRFPLLLPDKVPFACVALIKDKAVREFVDWLLEQPFNEAAFWLASAYALWVGETAQAQQALFFTPPMMAERVIDNLLKHGASLTGHHWHDPACGGAAFLVPIAQRMTKELTNAGVSPKKQIERIEKNLSGNDLDPLLLQLSSTFLGMSLYPLIEATGVKPQIRLCCGDGLTASSLRSLKPHVLALNPPYRKLKRSEVTRYRPLHSDVIDGQPNVYGLFMNRALQLVAEGGLIGLLTPTSFLSGRSFMLLREKLLASCDALQIDMLSDRKSVFMNVEQETAVTILKVRDNRRPTKSATEINLLESGGKFTVVGHLAMPSYGNPWPIPRSAEDAQWITLVSTSRSRIGDYGYQATIGSLVAYRDKRTRLAVSPSEIDAGLVLPLIWATDISPEGTFVHGRTAGHRSAERFVQLQNRSENCIIRGQAVILQRLTSSDQRSRLVAASVPNEFLKQHGGFVCENHVIVLRAVRDDALDSNLLAALLNTRCVNQVFRAISGSSNVSIFELDRLPLPHPVSFIASLSDAASMEEAVRAAYEKNRSATSRRA